MNNHKKKQFKLHIQHELAYEIISLSIITILLGLTFLTASNLLRFNWYTVIFLILTLVMIYLKWENQLVISDDQLSITYYKFRHPIKLNMQAIDKICFYERERYVDIKIGHGESYRIYMRVKNQKKLLNYIVKYYPEVNCIFNDI